MKKTKLTIALVMMIALQAILNAANAQHVATSSSFEGFWAGETTNNAKESDKDYLMIKILNGKATRYYYNSETEEFSAHEPDKENTMILGNNVCYTWMNKGGVWSETQTHLLSYIEPGALWCHMIRQVNNEQEDEDVEGINDEWHTIFNGRLNYYKSIEEFKKLLFE